MLYRSIFALLLSVSLLVSGCATTGQSEDPTLKTAAKPAYSIEGVNDSLIVSVSPARQTLQIAGSTGAILGAGISAISNAKHRRAITEAIGGYDCGAVFEERLESRLLALVPNGERVSNRVSTAGYRSHQEAEQARYDALDRNGHALVLDLSMTYGLFGFEGTLIAKFDGALRSMPDGSAIWRESIVVNSASILASDRLADPSKTLAPNFSSPRLKVEDDAIAQWTGDGGKVFQERYVTAVDGCVSAVLTDLGLVDEALGHYYLGKQKMNQKKFEAADKHFRRALELDPSLIEAQNGFAVNLAHNGQIEEAIAADKALIENHPDYAAGQFNLAYWYAIDQGAPEEARSYYKKAQELGLPSLKKIDKALNK